MSTIAKAEKLAAQMDRFNVPTTAFRRGPNGTDVFSISIRGGEVMVWAGTAETTVHGSKKHRQVVLNVEEKARKVSHDVTIDAWAYSHAKLSGHESALRNRFPVSFPASASVKWSYTGWKETTHEDAKKQIGKTEPGNRKFTAKVTATVPATSQSFLVGYDEHNLFVSMLPKKANSVEAAHAMLRPKGVTDAAERQGEWFFEPVSENTSATLDRYVGRNPAALTYSRLRLGSRDGGDHRTLHMEMRGKTYAIGFVIDRRGERSTHHEPLWLADWHQIFRNTEVQAPASVGTQRRSWD